MKGLKKSKLTKQECPQCFKCTVTIAGFFSVNGDKLPNGYKPHKGELIKNEHMKCSSCTFEQWS